MKSTSLDNPIYPNNFGPNNFPKLKAGISYFKTEDKFKVFLYVGFKHRGIELTSEIAPLLLKQLDGTKSLKTIRQAIALKIESESKNRANHLEQEITGILSALYLAGFIEVRSTKFESVVAGEFAPINSINLRNRLRAVENLYCWHPEVTAGRTTQELIESRRTFAIIIFGRNRLAITLFSILQASGFNQIKIIDRSISPTAAAMAQIAPDEVCGLAIRGSDVGVRKPLVIADLARNSQLFPMEDLKFPPIPDFIISTESAPQETIQRWMSELIPHLAISKLIENTVEIGPIVIPGRSPCLNCLSLWRSDQFPHHKEFEFIAALEGTQEKSLEIPSAQVALLAGLIAIHLIEYSANPVFNPSIDETGAKLIGATQSINLFDPFSSGIINNSGSQYRYWQPHISCGCQNLI